MRIKILPGCDKSKVSRCGIGFIDALQQHVVFMSVFGKITVTADKNEGNTESMLYQVSRNNQGVSGIIPFSAKEETVGCRF